MIPHATKSQAGPVNTSQSPFTKLRTLGFRDVSLNGGFWAKELAVNRKTSLRFGYQMLNKAGNFNNLRIAAGLTKGMYQGYVFQDSDIYKWLEALAWEMGKEQDRELMSFADQAITLIASAQRPDGYINSYVQTREIPEPWLDLDNGHELYCAGHLFQAAVAFERALGDRRLLEIACRFADHICSVFGPGKRQGACGHPEVEMALVELFRATGKTPYLELAMFFVDQRGQNIMKGQRAYGPEYHQDHVRVRDTVEAAGHAVRQLYLASGATDLFLETGDQSLWDAMVRLSNDITQTKLYITGGMGARFDGEAFGDPYELPADQCYCETCAAIASYMWNWRMLLASGESRFADEMERALYNTILSSPALDGQHFFYINPLMLRDAKYLRLSTDLPPSEAFVPDQRPEWHDCACCPPNVMRLFSSLTHYLATYDAGGIQIHHFAPANMECTLTDSSPIKLEMTTGYPWQGNIRLRIIETQPAPWTLSIRIPAWSKNSSWSCNRKSEAKSRYEKGYLVLECAWQVGDLIELNLGMEATLVESNPRVDATRGCLAIQRGPLVYCLEDKDQAVQGRLLDVEIDKNKPLLTKWDPDLLNGIMVIEADGQFIESDDWKGQLYLPVATSARIQAHPARLIAIPYFAWGNRKIGGMRVWIPATSKPSGETE